MTIERQFNFVIGYLQMFYFERLRVACRISVITKGKDVGKREIRMGRQTSESVRVKSGEWAITKEKNWTQLFLKELMTCSECYILVRLKQRSDKCIRKLPKYPLPIESFKMSVNMTFNSCSDVQMSAKFSVKPNCFSKPIYSYSKLLSQCGRV